MMAALVDLTSKHLKKTFSTPLYSEFNIFREKNLSFVNLFENKLIPETLMYFKLIEIYFYSEVC